MQRGHGDSARVNGSAVLLGSETAGNRWHWAAENGRPRIQMMKSNGARSSSQGCNHQDKRQDGQEENILLERSSAIILKNG